MINEPSYFDKQGDYLLGYYVKSNKADIGMNFKASSYLCVHFVTSSSPSEIHFFPCVNPCEAPSAVAQSFKIMQHTCYLYEPKF